MNKGHTPDYVAELNGIFADIDKRAQEKKAAKEAKKEQNKKTKSSSAIHKGHRERMDKKVELGLENLPEHEQLEWILYLTIHLKDTNKIAHELLDKFGTLQGVFSASEAELRKVNGVDHRTAMLLTYMNDLAGLVMRSWQNSKSLEDDKHMLEYVKSYFVGKNIECVYMFILDASCRVKSVVKLSEGICDEAPMYYQAVSRIAITNNAHSVIIAHNHPSGTCKPSSADEYVVKNVAAALGAVGVKLHDSIIVTDGDCYSMKKAGKLFRVKIENL